MFAYFDKTVVLNVPSAQQRLSATVQELQRVGITDYTVFSAIPDIGPHESFNRSVHTILQNAYNEGAGSVLLLEDDVMFGDTYPLHCALHELRPDWDILYLGANLQEPGFLPPIRVMPHLCRVFNAWTTHAIAFNRKCISWLLKNQPGFSERMFDNWLSDQLLNFKAYCVTPMVAVQRPGESLIWKGAVNYNHIFVNSDRILKTSK